MCAKPHADIYHTHTHILYTHTDIYFVHTHKYILYTHNKSPRCVNVLLYYDLETECFKILYFFKFEKCVYVVVVKYRDRWVPRTIYDLHIFTTDNTLGCG